MSEVARKGWQAIRDEVLRRIHAREWPPGTVIPNEADLALEFGCARATVNRALRAVADAGLLERRRKAGTRVALHPISRATVDIPVIRQEVEALGRRYDYTRLARDTEDRRGPNLAATLGHGGGTALHVTGLHRAEGKPYVFEDRWISLSAVPAAAEEPFDRISANEWLLTHAPYTHGDISFAAEAAATEVAQALAVTPGTPVFVIERLTWNADAPVTFVRLSYAPGYRIRTSI